VFFRTHVKLDGSFYIQVELAYKMKSIAFSTLPVAEAKHDSSRGIIAGTCGTIFGETGINCVGPLTFY